MGAPGLLFISQYPAFFIDCLEKMITLPHDISFLHTVLPYIIIAVIQICVLHYSFVTFEREKNEKNIEFITTYMSNKSSKWNKKHILTDLNKSQ